MAKTGFPELRGLCNHTAGLCDHPSFSSFWVLGIPCVHPPSPLPLLTCRHFHRPQPCRCQSHRISPCLQPLSRRIRPHLRFPAIPVLHLLEMRLHIRPSQVPKPRPRVVLASLRSYHYLVSLSVHTPSRHSHPHLRNLRCPVSIHWRHPKTPRLLILLHLSPILR